MAFPAVHLQWKILLWAAPRPTKHLGNSKYPTQVPTSFFIEKGRTTQQWSKLQFNFQPVVKWKVCKTTHRKYARNKYGLFLSMNVRQRSMHLIQLYFDRYSIIPNLWKFYSMIFQTSKRYKIIFCFVLLSMTFYKVNIQHDWNMVQVHCPINFDKLPFFWIESIELFILLTSNSNNSIL